MQAHIIDLRPLRVMIKGRGKLRRRNIEIRNVMSEHAAIDGRPFQRVRIPCKAEVRRRPPGNPRQNFRQRRSVHILRFRVAVKSHRRSVKLTCRLNMPAQNIRRQGRHRNPIIDKCGRRLRVLDLIIRQRPFFQPERAADRRRRGRALDLRGERCRAVERTFFENLAGIEPFRPREQMKLRLFPGKIDGSPYIRGLPRRLR